MGSPTKFFVNGNAIVSVLMNLLSVTVFETEIRKKRVKPLFLRGGKKHTFSFIIQDVRS